MSELEPDGSSRRALSDRLAAFSVPGDLLRQALAHRSFCAETPSQPSNERLELLGDAVLGLVITDHLYASFPELPEGDLARVRAAVVSTLALAPAAEALGIGPALLLGKGEVSSGGRQKASILADCVEAVIGAVYLSAGLGGARTLVLDLLGAHVIEIAQSARLGDPKNRLQEIAVQMLLGPPVYTVQERGPDHAKQFTAEAVVGGERLGTGVGRSKKDAERHAAEVALAVLLERARSGRPGDGRDQGDRHPFDATHA
ncbi:MAG TPA: ribonuclease III [Acidimicrobiales bacterium]|nr:ribonuclease III [Acidimicrobiales bacterium]